MKLRALKYLKSLEAKTIIELIFMLLLFCCIVLVYTYMDQGLTEFMEYFLTIALFPAFDFLIKRLLISERGKRFVDLLQITLSMAVLVLGVVILPKNNLLILSVIALVYAIFMVVKIYGFKIFKRG
jgi:hypothetical protein